MILYLCTHSYIGKAHLNSACYGVIMVIFHVPTSLCFWERLSYTMKGSSSYLYLWKISYDWSDRHGTFSTCITNASCSMATIPFVVVERSVELGIELSVGSNTSKSSLQTKLKHFVRDSNSMEGYSSLVRRIWNLC